MHNIPSAIFETMRACCRVVLLWSMVSVVAFAGMAQSDNVRFGQNRVQYRDFIFSYYQSDHFITHFYQGGQDVAKYVIKTAESSFEQISALIDVRTRRKLDIIIYNHLAELNQTNVGIYSGDAENSGSFNVPADKIFIYFNGNKDHLDKQIREQIARVLIQEHTKYFSREVMGTPGDWYEQGLIQYIANGWNTDYEDHLREGILNNRYTELNKLPISEAVFVGHSLWHYIEEVHGKNAISNILYLARINRNLDNAFVFVLSANVEQTLQNWYNYYNKRFSAEQKKFAQPAADNRVPFKTRKETAYYHSQLNPDGKTIAYAQNERGRQKVKLLATESKKNKTLLRNGFRSAAVFTDNDMPLLAWNKRGTQLAMVYEKRAKTWLLVYDTASRKTEKFPIRKFQKVTSISFMPDGKQLLMSATNRGESNIYLYNLASTTTRQLTNDYYDDLDPVYVKAGSYEGVMFRSNRTDDVLREEHFENQLFINRNYDLWFYDLNKGGSELYRITNTPSANESAPAPFSDSRYQYLSDENGIRNRYTGELKSVFERNDLVYHIRYRETGETDSVILRESIAIDSVMDMSSIEVLNTTLLPVYKIKGVNQRVSDYLFNIREQSATAAGKALEVFEENGKPMLFINSVNGEAKSPEQKTEFIKKQAAQLPIARPEEKSTASADTMPARWNSEPKPNWFQSEFDNGPRYYSYESLSSTATIAAEPGTTTDEAGRNYSYTFSRVRPYFVRFMIDEVIANLFDNEILMTRYQPFDPYTPNFMGQALKANLQLGITDLLENHKMTGGVRIPWDFNFRNFDWFLTYENLEKRLDKKFTFFYGSQYNKTDQRVPFSNIPLPQGYIMEYMTKTIQLQTELKYAIDVHQSLKATLAWRNDRIKLISQDEFTLKTRYLPENWLMLRSEYIFDNSLQVMENIRQGTRFRVFTELHKRFPTKENSFGEFDISYPTWDSIWFMTFGLDFRHHQRVYRQITWCNRVSWGTSVGNYKLIYYLGGLDNWFGVQTFDNTTPINFNTNYAYQTIATPLRGFLQNIRNGNNYVLLNSELRVPLFTAFRNFPPRTELLRNFMLVLFFDVGTAWEGLSPFSEKNPLFNEEYYNPAPPYTSTVLRVKRYKNPVVFGLGPGVRTTLFGFFLRIDAGWGWDTGVFSKRPQFYFTLSRDF